MRKLLLILRAVIFFLLALSFFDFSFMKKTKFQGPPHVFVVMDSSLSMSLPLRLKREKEIAAELFPMEKNKKDSHPYLYSFSDNLYPLSDYSLLSAAGKETAFRSTLAKIMDASWKLSPDFVFFLSDGADTQKASYDDILQSFHESSIPFYTVYTGTDASFPDVEVLDVQNPERVKIGEKVSVEALVSQHGFTGEKAVVQLLLRDGSIQKKTVTFNPEAEQSIHFDLRITKPGIVVGKIFVVPPPSEKGIYNNEKYFSFVVEKEKWNVLFFRGTLSWEYSFLQRFLASHPKLSLKMFWLRPDGMSTSSVPGRLLSNSDVVIFADAPCGALKRFTNTNKASFNLVLAGDTMKKSCMNSANLFPFSFLSQSGSNDVFKVSPKSLELFLHLSVQKNSMPQNLFLSNVFPVKIHGQSVKTSLEAETLEGKKMPLFLLKDDGVKKIGYFLSSSTWKWAFSKDEKQINAYLTLWEEILGMFLKKPDQHFEIYTQRQTFSQNESARMFISYSGDAEDNPVFSAKVVTPSGKVKKVGIFPHSPLAAVFSSSFAPSEEGKHLLVVSGHTGDKILGTKKQIFYVKSFPKDYEDSEGKPETMKEIALKTGGKYFSYDDAVRHKDKILNAPKKISESQNVIKITRSAPFLLILLFLFCTDIFLRKRAGLP